MDKINLGGLPFTIAFSGGCFSGKTSTMEALKFILEKEGYNVVIISEAMRETEVAKSGMSIDAIRQDANLYFKLQKEISILEHTSYPRPEIKFYIKNIVEQII